MPRHIQHKDGESRKSLALLLKNFLVETPMIQHWEVNHLSTNWNINQKRFRQ